MEDHFEKDQFGVLQDGIVYLKQVDPGDLPDDMVEDAGSPEKLWSVHNSEGEQLALIADLAMAHDLAQQFDYKAHVVH